MPEPREPRKQQVFSITSAAESQTADRLRREKRYAISMLVRTLCFLGGVVLVMQPLPWAVIGWLMFLGALVLPYVAVVFANAGVRKKGDGPSPFGPEAASRSSSPAPPRSIVPEALICSAKGCTAAAQHQVLWNNPKLHTPDRRKTWLACDEHEETLRAFLGARGFWKETLPLDA